MDEKSIHKMVLRFEKIWMGVDKAYFFILEISKIKTHENPRNKASKKHKNTILAPSICQHSNVQFRVSPSGAIQNYVISLFYT